MQLAGAFCSSWDAKMSHKTLASIHNISQSRLSELISHFKQLSVTTFFGLLLGKLRLGVELPQFISACNLAVVVDAFS